MTRFRAPACVDCGAHAGQPCRAPWARGSLSSSSIGYAVHRSRFVAVAGHAPKVVR